MLGKRYLLAPFIGDDKMKPGEFMESLNLKDMVIMSEAEKSERATTMVKASTSQVIGDGSARKLDEVKFNTLTISSLRDSLNYNENYSGGLFCKNVKHVAKKRILINLLSRDPRKGKFTIVDSVKIAIINDGKKNITKIINMNLNIEETIIDRTKKNGQRNRLQMSKEKGKLKNNGNEEGMTEEEVLRISKLCTLSYMGTLAFRIIAKSVIKETQRLLDIIQITINHWKYNGFVKVVMPQYMVLNAG